VSESAAAIASCSASRVTKKNGAVIPAVTIKPATAISHGRELSDLDCSTGTGGA
jgi:hypothetical protein